ncbi:MAG: hypothetical protein KF850_14800 [Labilithrix sp.]|nr:hypothetical protein [Labilithrix sp.]MBX3213302.1 hypothetical protein [Labilithrix sp.]
MRRSLLVLSSLVLGLSVIACGGGSEEPKTPADKASAPVSPMEELKAIPADLDAEVASLTKPIDDVQSIIDELGAFPKKHGLAAADVMGMAKATFDSGKVEMNLKADVAAEAAAELEVLLKRLNDTVIALKATPDHVAALTAKATAATAKVPLLATKVSSSASVTVANPFGSAEDKAKAQAEIDGVKQVQADTSKSISDVQAKVTGIPQMATAALAKLTASFAAGT